MDRGGWDSYPRVWVSGAKNFQDGGGAGGGNAASGYHNYSPGRGTTSAVDSGERPAGNLLTTVSMAVA